MRRILLTVAYDGTEYHGWQVQEGVSTIEGELNRAIEELTGSVTEVIGASRTDAGVHGLCNRAVFDTDSSIPADRFAPGINTFLPHDIRVTSSSEVPNDWHPRKVSTHKTYEYRIDRNEVANPLRARYTWNVWGDLDIERMTEAAAYLTGVHDFTSFCAAASPVEDKVREIIAIDITEHGHELAIRVKGTGFLYNMVRIIVGTLVAVGQGKMQPEQMADILASCDRTKAGQTAPAKGLTLVSIEDVKNV